MTDRKRPRTGLDALEIGCGTGLLSFMVAPYVRSLVGADTAEGMIDAFKTKLSQPDAPKNIMPVCKLVESVEDADLQATAATLQKRLGGTGSAESPCRFDLIISHLTLHHIPSLPTILELMHDCLRPGGRLALTDFEDTGEEAILFHPAGKKRDGVERHGIKREDFARMMGDAGFVEVKVDAAFMFDKYVEEKKSSMQFPFMIATATKR